MSQTYDHHFFFISWAMVEGRPKGLGSRAQCGVGDKNSKAPRVPPPDFPDPEYMVRFCRAAQAAGIREVVEDGGVSLLEAYKQWYRDNEPEET